MMCYREIVCLGSTFTTITPLFIAGLIFVSKTRFVVDSLLVQNEECPVGSGGSIYLLSHGDGSFSM